MPICVEGSVSKTYERAMISIDKHMSGLDQRHFNFINPVEMSKRVGNSI